MINAGSAYTKSERTQRTDAKTMTKPDGELLTKLLIEVADNESRTAFESLFSYFAPKIRSYGMRTLHQEALALELVQETMMLVWRKASLFNREKGAATTWIFTIMRNVSFDMLRKMQSNREDNISSDIWPLFEEDGQRCDEQAAKDQLHGNLMAISTSYRTCSSKSSEAFTSNSSPIKNWQSNSKSHSGQ